MNALDRMDNYQIMVYEHLKKRIMANPIADANRSTVIETLHALLEISTGSPDVFLVGMRNLADHLDEAVEIAKHTQTPLESFSVQPSVVEHPEYTKLYTVPPKRPILERILTTLRNLLR